MITETELGFMHVVVEDIFTRSVLILVLNPNKIFTSRVR